jgi:capping protein beta
MRQKEQDASTNDSTHIANIGRMVEEMENQIRQSLNTIYFDKTKSILNSLRSPVDGEEKAKREALKSEIISKVPMRQTTPNE